MRARFLHDVLKHEVTLRAGARQRLGNMQGLVGDSILCFLPAPPEFRATVTLSPDAISRVADLRIRPVLQNQPVWSTQVVPHPDHPFVISITLGAYEILAQHVDYHPAQMVWIPKADERGSKKSVQLRPLALDS